MESARLAYVSEETHVWNPPTGRAQNWQRPGHDKGPSEWAIDWPHCEGKLKYGIPGPGDTQVWHHPDFGAKYFLWKMPKGLVTQKKSGAADGGEIIEKFIAAEGGSILKETSLCAAKGNTTSVEKSLTPPKP